MPKKKKGRQRTRVKRFVSGPLTVEQFGTEIFARTDWDPDEFEKHRQRLKRRRPELRADIEAKIREIEEIARSYSPFIILSEISAENCIGAAETGPRRDNESNVCYAEYAQSVILAQEKTVLDVEPPDDIVERFKSLIKNIFDDVRLYFTFEMAEDGVDRARQYLRFISIMQYLFVRGDSIPQHHSELMRHRFCPHDAFFITHYGFSASEIIDASEDIERQLEQRFNTYVTFQIRMEALREKFAEFVAVSPDQMHESEQIATDFLLLPGIEKEVREAIDMQANIKEQPFSIEPTEVAPEQILRQLSATFGDNSDFSTFRKAPAWPTNDSIVYSRPLIEHRGTYYCFVPQLLFNNMGQILEQWILDKDKAYFNTAYQNTRARYLETKALEYLGKILPGAQVFGKLFYHVIEDGQRKRVETDGLILYDENLIVVEAKAGALHVSSRRGGLERMEKDCREIIQKAYQQGQRTLTYIRDMAEPRFEYEDGKEALTLKNKGNYSDHWMINISGENLGHLASQLNSLQALNLMQVAEWPWSVFVNDLRVISDLIEFPSELFHYLKRRTRLNQFPQFRSSDELDVFMFYLKKGLYFDEERLSQLDSFMATGFTLDLDRYYSHLLGVGPVAAKPGLGISEPFKLLLLAIEETGKTGRTRLLNTLLSFDRREQDETIKKLVEFARRSREDGELHDVSVRNRQANAAMTFFFYPHYDLSDLEHIRRYSLAMKYHNKLDEYSLITVDTSKPAWTGLDFETFRYEWTYDHSMEEVVQKLRMWRVQREGQAQGKIGRNAPCPCHSGKKYKKCCGKSVDSFFKSNR